MPNLNSGKVLLAAPRGFCAGVERAVAIVERELNSHDEPIYVRKEIVHNHHVVRDLERRGARFVDSEEEVPAGAICVFSAHGVSPAVRANAARRNLRVIDATCPLVSKVHQEVRRFSRDGRTIVLIGHEGHEEVEGTAGHAPDQTHVVATVDDVHDLHLPAGAPIAYVSQTTLSLDETSEVVTAVRERFPDVAEPGSDDICYASQNRQNAVRALAGQADLVLVVGSANSSNSVRMVEVAARAGAPAYLVPDPLRLDRAWFTGVGTVGVSSGASAPEHLVDQLLEELAGLGYRDVETVHVADEDVMFALPPQRAGRTEVNPHHEEDL